MSRAIGRHQASVRAETVRGPRVHRGQGQAAAGDAGPGHGDTGTAAGPGWPGEQLIEGKLGIPRPGIPLLSRPRVLRLLDRALRRRVTLVCAPAGSGKTVACAAWAAGSSRRVVWLTLDAADRLDWFWAYVVAGFRRAGAAPEGTLRALEACSPRAFPLSLVGAAREFAEPVVLILDDLHEVADEAVSAGLAVLARHAPAALRLVLSTRRPPPMQLARFRIAGELSDIGAADLACTAEEADAYFRMLGLEIGASARDELLSRTEGWMAGLRLAAMRAEAGGEQSTAAVAGLAGDEPLVADYLWDEVLAGQPPGTRAFLQRTSIVPELPVGLADALTSGQAAAALLERLSRENHFVEAPGSGREGYRYHPLMRDALMAGLAREIPEEIGDLHRRAAAWYESQGRALDAARSAAGAGDWHRASDVLARSGLGAVLPGQRELESVLALFPADWAAGDASVAAAWAAARLWDGDRDGARGYLDSAARVIGSQAPQLRRVVGPLLAGLSILCEAEADGTGIGPAREGRCLAEQAQPGIASQAEHRALGTLWFALGMSDLRRWAIGSARHALGRADVHLGAGRLAGLRARARSWRALAEASAGDLVGAKRAADDVRSGAMPAAGEASCLATLAYAQVGLARDDLAAARRLLAETDTCPMGHVPGEPPVACVAALLSARASLADGDIAGARATLARTQGAWPPGRMPLREAMTVTEAEVALRAGDTGRARALLLLAGGGEDGAGGDVTLARAGLSLAEGDYPAALAGTGPLLAAPEASSGEDQAWTRHQRIRALLVAAVAHRRLGDAGQASEAVEHALGLAEPQDAYRVFLDEGGAVRSAVTVLVPPTSRCAGFAGRVLERFDAQAAPRPPVPAEAENIRLTQSERAVLCFLPSHMTNEEISQALYLSVNTVKTHLRSAYRKLGVGSRREAIARGRRLGLL